MFQPLVRVVFTVSLLLAGTTGQAAEAPINCVKVDKDGGSQYEMNVCQGQKFGAADAELNKVYGQLRQLFQQNKDTEGEMLMIKAQRAWVTWRMAEGEFCAQTRGFSRGGSGYGMVVQSCETDLTRERTASLRNRLQDAERF